MTKARQRQQKQSRLAAKRARKERSRATQPPKPPRSLFPAAELTPEEQGNAIEDADEVEAMITALEADEGGEGVGGD